MVSIMICLMAGFIGSIVTTPAIPDWYATLQKPAFTPPNWVFAPVWTTLYVLMGISLFLVWRLPFTKTTASAIIVFGIQLFFNICWSILFFGFKSPLLAFIDIIFLWIAILLTIIKFYKVSAIASLLLIPYLLWVSFASILNLAIVVLN
ncbi:MAG: tryptophan-rich sensory protein [Candidatus Sumerlaeia bacterium]|nr:tryptophan-rich sensory protein [Candidatus Sumerlaeia bacterium]